MPKTAQIRAIEEEAARRANADGKTSHAERFGIRNELRAAEGLPSEKHKRGGVAGAYDANKSWVVPVLAGLAGLTGIGGAALPAILGGLKGFDREGESGIGFDVGQGLAGAATGYGAGKVGGAIGDLAGLGAGAAGAVPVPPVAGGVPGAASLPGASGAVPAVTAGGSGGFGGFVDRAKDLLTPENILTGLQGFSAARNLAKESALTNEAVGLDRNRWRDNAPLRNAGREGLLNPEVADTSALRTLAGQGNPFALPVPPAPAAPPGGGPIPVPPMTPKAPTTPRRVR